MLRAIVRLAVKYREFGGLVFALVGLLLFSLFLVLAKDPPLSTRMRPFCDERHETTKLRAEIFASCVKGSKRHPYSCRAEAEEVYPGHECPKKPQYERYGWRWCHDLGSEEAPEVVEACRKGGDLLGLGPVE